MTFTPDDLNLVKGSDRHRRRELDVLGAQLNANYFQLVRDYDKVLRQEESAAKGRGADALAGGRERGVRQGGEQLTSYRAALFGRLAPHVSAHYADISGDREQLGANYVRSWEGEGTLATPSTYGLRRRAPHAGRAASGQGGLRRRWAGRALLRKPRTAAFHRAGAEAGPRPRWWRRCWDSCRCCCSTT